MHSAASARAEFKLLLLSELDRELLHILCIALNCMRWYLLVVSIPDYIQNSETCAVCHTLPV